MTHSNTGSAGKTTGSADFEKSEVADAFWTDVADRLRRFVQSRVSEPHTVDDLVQDVVLKVQANLHSAPIENLSSWMFQVARNRIIDHYRSAAHRKASSLDEEAAAQDDEPDLISELSGCLRAMLSRLPAPAREVLEQTDLGELTQAELAQTLGLSLPGAKSRVQRARELLRAALISCCAPEAGAEGGIVDHQCDCGPPDYCGKKTGKC